MGLFKKKKYKPETITCSEDNYLVWKWKPNHKSKLKGKILVGDKIQVKEGASAVFVYKNEMGTYLDFITGPIDEILSPETLPIISNIMGESFADGAIFDAEIYFINLTKVIQSRFEVCSFEVHDPSAPDIGVPVTVKGVLTYRIVDAAEFVKRHRLDEITEDSLTNQVIEAAGKYIKSAIMNAPSVDNLPVVEFERRINEINDLVEIPIRERLAEDLGVKVASVDIGTIDIDESSEGYKKLMGQSSPESSSITSTSQSSPQSPSVKYYLGLNGKPAGPYNVETIKKMLAEGTAQGTTLAWKSGMTEWVKLENLNELK